MGFIIDTLCSASRLENEGYGIFWPFLEPEAPITGIDLISLSIDDWYRLFNEKENLRQRTKTPQEPSRQMLE